MLDVARIYLFVFGILTIAGGVLGYVKAKSGASIVAGSVFGVALLAAGYLSLHGSRGGNTGLWIGLGISAMLTGRFSTAFRKNGKFIPAGLMTMLGLAGMGLMLAALFTR